ncbi:MAG: DUF1847 domain-containing protein [Deltaproteobacteria bacterium]|nr:DUF1847 domain-containing protein [Deltaproteobacteria bacterium]
MDCARCKTLDCYTKAKDCTGRKEEIAGLYKDREELAIMEAAAALEAEGSMMLPRVQEVILLGKKIGYRHLGLAFCAGLHREARLLQELLRPHFEITSACCKVCGITKEDFTLPKLRDNPNEVICNPLGQADILNCAGTELNLLLGLCLGHDMLFTRHSSAPVSTVIVKDRVLANNPAGALYSPYWMRMIKENSLIGKGE